MAVIIDPVGAALCLWEARSNIGATLVNTPGVDDLERPDHARPGRRRRSSTATCSDGRPRRCEGGQGYRVISNGERSNGGMMPAASGMPPSWMPYFGHEDVDRLVGEVGDLGGQVFNGPMQLPTGRIAVLGDPQGAVFAVWTGTYDD